MMNKESIEKTKNIDYWENWDSLSQLAKDIIALAKRKGASSSEISINLDKGLSANIRKSKVDTLEFHRDKSVSITTYRGKRKGNASISDLSKEAISEALDKALKIAEYTEEDNCAGLANADLMAKNLIDLDLYHPHEIDSQKAISLAQECEEAAFSFSDKIFNSDGASFTKSSGFYVYGNSHGFIGSYPSSSYCMSLAVIAKESKSSEDMQRDYDYTFARCFDDLTNFKDVGVSAAKKTINRLNARKISTTKVPVIFNSNIASGLFRSFISAISGGNLYRKSSFLLDSLNTKVFPEFIQIKEDPFIPKGIGSCTFDSDGVATKTQDIVLNGVVNSYILNSYSARKLGMKTTGNAGGVHNLIISNGSYNFDDLLKKMDKGLLVTELMGHGVNIVTGDYSQGAFGFWVENGKIQYPVHEITIASNLKDMFKNIVALGNDVDLRKNIRTGSVLLSEMMVAGH